MGIQRTHLKEARRVGESARDTEGWREPPPLPRTSLVGVRTILDGKPLTGSRCEKSSLPSPNCRRVGQTFVKVSPPLPALPERPLITRNNPRPGPAQRWHQKNLQQQPSLTGLSLPSVPPTICCPQVLCLHLITSLKVPRAFAQALCKPSSNHPIEVPITDCACVKHCCLVVFGEPSLFCLLNLQEPGGEHSWVEEMISFLPTKSTGIS